METQATWPLGGYLHLNDDSIVVQAMHQKVEIRPENVVELRYYSRLIPHIVAITEIGDEYASCTYWGLRGKRLIQIFKDRGFTFHSNAKWTPVNQIAEDCAKYKLHKGIAP